MKSHSIFGELSSGKDASPALEKLRSYVGKKSSEWKDEVNYLDQALLYKAIYINDAPIRRRAVQVVLDAGVSIDWVLSGGNQVNILQHTNDPFVLQMMLDHGADPNLQCDHADRSKIWENAEENVPPLHQACINKNAVVAAVLLRGGADPAVRSSGKTDEDCCSMDERTPAELVGWFSRMTDTSNGWCRWRNASYDNTPNQEQTRLEAALRKGGDSREECLKEVVKEFKGEIKLRFPDFFYSPRCVHLLKCRRAHEARRDAGMVFQAAAEGRPLELAKRLRLGMLAGGLERTGPSPKDGREVTLLTAAEEGGHDECVKVLARVYGSRLDAARGSEIAVVPSGSGKRRRRRKKKGSEAVAEGDGDEKPVG